MILLALGAVAWLGAACGNGAPVPDVVPTASMGSSTIVPVEDVEWEQLNPARGDASPAAATLWGDRKAAVPTGFLVRFVDGFASPPHIHNVSYRGIVIRGLVHNDDPEAEAMWMPTGSYWTQPQGGAHITSASGGGAVAFIEIDSGPYLVRPVDQASAGSEHPVNVHVSNLVWIGFASLGWGEASAAPEPKVAFLWGAPDGTQARGMLLEIPAGQSVLLRGVGGSFQAVVVEGGVEHQEAGGGASTPLAPGSYLANRGGAARVTCAANTSCKVYTRAEGHFEVAAVPSF